MLTRACFKCGATDHFIRDCSQRSCSIAPVQVNRPVPTVQRGKRQGRAETADISQKIIFETVEKPEVRVAPWVYAMEAQEEPNPDIDEAIQGSDEARRQQLHDYLSQVNFEDEI